MNVELEFLLLESSLAAHTDTLLQTLDDSSLHLNTEQRNRLRREKWLPVGNDVIAPENLLHLPELEGLIERVASLPEAGHLIPSSWISEELQKRPAWTQILTLLPSTEGVLARLIEHMKGLATYRLGFRPGDVKPGEEPALLNALDSIDTALVPAYPLLRYVGDQRNSHGLLESIHLLAGPAELKHAQDLLCALGGILELRPDHHDARWLHRLILSESLLAYPDRTWLHSLKLPSQAGQWRLASELCLDVEGVAATFTLHEALKRLFERPEKTGPEAAEVAGNSLVPPTMPLKSSLVLEEYLYPLKSKVDPAVLGGLVSVLGKGFKKLAEDYLQDRFQVTTLLQRLDDPTQTRKDALAVGASQRLPELIDTVTIVLSPPDKKELEKIPALNLLGELREFTANQRPESIFSGNPVYERARGHYCIRLRELGDCHQLTSQDVLQLIKNSTEVFFRKVLHRTPANLDAVFEELSQTDQLDLEVTQEVVLAGLPHYAPQLGRRQIPTLKSFLDGWRSIGYDEASERRSQLKGRPLSLDSAAGTQHASADRKRKILVELKHSLETDAQFQHQLLAAVREKIKEFQYSTESVLFELFQNADDAVSELGKMSQPAEPPAGTDRLHIQFGPGQLTLIHYGRNINQLWFQKFSATEGRKLGYERDLEKMLTLMASDKATRSDLTTGHFGLGFKGVFLLCPRPVLLSGRLAVEIVGGLYPQDLESNRRKQLEEILLKSRGTKEHHQGTLFHLTDVPPVDLLQTQEPFLQVAPLLLAFSHRLKVLHLTRADGSTSVSRLNDTELSDQHPELRLAHVVSPQHGAVRPLKALRLRLDEGTAALLLELGSRGVQKLTAGNSPGGPNGNIGTEVPGFWVTAPTREELGLGFAINGPFQLDAGRLRLAGLDENVALARCLGVALGAQLEALWALSKDWKSLRARLEFLPSVSRDDFWTSLWELLATAPADGSPSATVVSRQLLHSLLWKPGSGIEKLLESGASVIPTGLQGQWECCTSLSSIKTIADESLFESRTGGSQDKRLRILEDLPPGKTRPKPGQIIAPERAEQLQRQLTGLPVWPRLKLLELLNTLIPATDRVEPGHLPVLAKLLSSDRLASLRDNFKPRYDEVLDRLRTLRYQNINGEWHVAGELLIDSGRLDDESDDEGWRRDFAPAEFHLHPLYAKDVLYLFRLSRKQDVEESKALAGKLARWGLEATTDTFRKAFLNYLLRGTREVVARVTSELKSRMRNTWLERLDKQPILDAFTGPERTTLLGLLGFVGQNFHSPTHEAGSDTPRIDLNAVLDWWKRNRSEQIQQYNQANYPAADQLFTTLSRVDDHSLAQREAWATLFLRGALESMGRTFPVSHREFLKLCQDRGWIRMLVDDTPSEALVSSIRSYVESQFQQVHRFAWIGPLLSLYLYKPWLDEYIKSFLALEQYRSDLRLEQILSPKSNPAFSGGGPDAPPLQPLMGLGGYFVLRELVRNRILTNPRLHPLCYVPYLRIRRMIDNNAEDQTMEDLQRGEQSRMVYAWVKDGLGTANATLCDDFDIALRMYQEVHGYP